MPVQNCVPLCQGGTVKLLWITVVNCFACKKIVRCRYSSSSVRWVATRQWKVWYLDAGMRLPEQNRSVLCSRGWYGCMTMWNWFYTVFVFAAMLHGKDSCIHSMAVMVKFAIHAFAFLCKTFCVMPTRALQLRNGPNVADSQYRRFLTQFVVLTLNLCFRWKKRLRRSCCFVRKKAHTSRKFEMCLLTVLKAHVTQIIPPPQTDQPNHDCLFLLLFVCDRRGRCSASQHPGPPGAYFWRIKKKITWGVDILAAIDHKLQSV